jgi:transposase
MCSIDTTTRTGLPMDKETLELLLGQGVSVERIAKRFGKDPSTVSYWMKKYDLKSPHARKHAARGGIDREKLEVLVAAGLSIAELAHELDRSKATVRHWLQAYALETTRTAHLRKWREAKATGQSSRRIDCPKHGLTEFIKEGRGFYRCKRCRAERVADRRRQVERVLVREAGGCCCICGYDKYVGALEFHHLDPAEKRLAISGQGLARSLETARAEAAKCVLVCSNCHAELEAGVVEI